eukprot:gb/GECG01001419.1/.p1 GENE.gb/GECG01001419.1/~~gb/GECG01001419.1/.p1  ORF type:complete len:1408 (+),score=162.66 gb/GECG01001419.1/:1-4224(+)
MGERKHISEQHKAAIRKGIGERMEARSDDQEQQILFKALRDVSGFVEGCVNAVQGITEESVRHWLRRCDSYHTVRNDFIEETAKTIMQHVPQNDSFEKIDQAHKTRRRIKQHIKEESFCELHTHLMGMGNAEFWLHYIHGWYVPRRLQHMCSELRLPFRPSEGDLGERIATECEQQWRYDLMYRDIFRHKQGDWAALDDFIEFLNNRWNGDDHKFSNVYASSHEILCHCLGSPIDPSKWEEVDMRKWKSHVTTKAKFGAISTADIVIKVETLRTAFDLSPYMHPTTCENHILSNLMLDPLKVNDANTAFRINDDTRRLLKTYSIWNARKQRIEHERGWPAMHLYRVLGLDFPQHHAVPPAHQIVRGVFLNCFSMLNEAGEDATEYSLQQYRGNFSPQFYPRRFKLKDDFYEQDLYILQLLLKWQQERYRQSGVLYVELSVSIHDLLRPWVFQHLLLDRRRKPFDLDGKDATTERLQTQQQKPEEREQQQTQQQPEEREQAQTQHQVPERSQTYTQEEQPSEPEQTQTQKDERQKKSSNKVLFCFLGGFSRSIVALPDIPSNDIARNTWEHQLLLCDQDEGPSLASLRELQSDDDWKQVTRPLEVLKKFISYDKNLVYLKHVVGLDYFGDEQGHPFIVFAAPQVSEVIARLRRTSWDESEKWATEMGHYNMFGIRIHGAELQIAGSEDRSSLWHISILVSHLKEFIDNMEYHSALWFSREPECPSFVRIGHGVAFVTADKLELFEKPLLSWLEQLQIPLELNLTSNHYLLPRANELHVLGYLRDRWRTIGTPVASKGLRGLVVLCCDNDGVWPLELARYHVSKAEFTSIPAEFEKAVTEHCFIDEDVNAFVENSRRFRFIRKNESLEIPNTSRRPRKSQPVVSKSKHFFPLLGASLDDSSSRIHLSPYDDVSGGNSVLETCDSLRQLGGKTSSSPGSLESLAIGFPKSTGDRERLPAALLPFSCPSSDGLERLVHPGTAGTEGIWIYATKENLVSALSWAAALWIRNYANCSEQLLVTVELLGVSAICRKQIPSQLCQGITCGLIAGRTSVSSSDISLEQFESLLLRAQSNTDVLDSSYDSRKGQVFVRPRTCCETFKFSGMLRQLLERFFIVKDTIFHKTHIGQPMLPWKQHSWSVFNFLLRLRNCHSECILFQFIKIVLGEDLVQNILDQLRQGHQNHWIADAKSKFKVTEMLPLSTEHPSTLSKNLDLDSTLCRPVPDRSHSNDNYSYLLGLSKCFHPPLAQECVALANLRDPNEQQTVLQNLAAWAESVDSFYSADCFFQYMDSQLTGNPTIFELFSQYNPPENLLGKLLEECVSNRQLYESVRYAWSPKPHTAWHALWPYALQKAKDENRQSHKYLLRLYGYYALRGDNPVTRLDPVELMFILSVGPLDYHRETYSAKRRKVE